MKVKIPDRLSEKEVWEMVDRLKEDKLEICGIIDGEEYVVNGAGVEYCSHLVDKENVDIFHIHPEDNPPSYQDLISIYKICGKSETFTPSYKYVMRHDCEADKIEIEKLGRW